MRDGGWVIVREVDTIGGEILRIECHLECGRERPMVEWYHRFVSRQARGHANSKTVVHDRRESACGVRCGNLAKRANPSAVHTCQKAAAMNEHTAATNRRASRRSKGTDVWVGVVGETGRSLSVLLRVHRKRDGCHIRTTATRYTAHECTCTISQGILPIDPIAIRKCTSTLLV